MSVIPFDQLPDSAKIWIYGISRPVHQDEIESLNKYMNRFIVDWSAHKRDLSAAWQLRCARFIVIGVDESRVTASGCSIDGLVRHLQELEVSLGIEIVNSNSRIFYRNKQGDIETVDRAVFGELAVTGTVDEDSVVFDNTIQTAGCMRSGKWEIKMRSAWHYDVFLNKRSLDVSRLEDIADDSSET